MDRWELLDSEPVPGGGGIMRLMRRGNEMVIRIDDLELMSTRIHGSEDALAELSLSRLPPGHLGEPSVRILIGGLGIGFTLAATLGHLGPDASVMVAELVPAVTRWNRGILGETAGHPLLDERVSIHEGDVIDLVRQPPFPWDAILLDVDNGPTSLTLASNGWLYGWQGLEAIAHALRPGGVLGVWSAAPDHAFTRRLERAGFDVELLRASYHTGQGSPWRSTTCGVGCHPQGRGFRFCEFVTLTRPSSPGHAPYNGPKGRRTK